MDRGLINDDWARLFPSAALEHLHFVRSDHRSLLVNTEYYANLNIAGVGAPPLRFEAHWLREESFSNTVKEAWVRFPGASSKNCSNT